MPRARQGDTTAASSEVLEVAPEAERPELARIAGGVAPQEQHTATLAVRLLNDGDAAAWAVAQRAPSIPTDTRADVLQRASTRLDDPVRDSKTKTLITTVGPAVSDGVAAAVRD